MAINYQLINEMNNEFKDFSLKKYCAANNHNYGSVRVGLTRYRNKIKKKSQSNKINLPTFNQLDQMINENHIDFDYWSKHKDKLRATIVRTLDWVRDFNI